MIGFLVGALIVIGILVYFGIGVYLAPAAYKRAHDRYNGTWEPRHEEYYTSACRTAGRWRAGLMIVAWPLMNLFLAIYDKGSARAEPDPLSKKQQRTLEFERQKLKIEQEKLKVMHDWEASVQRQAENAEEKAHV
jgi:hypothetical protein